MIKVINNYTLIQKIGEGNYGEVFRALNTKKLGEFAVKVIPIEKFQENRMLEQCTDNEIKTLTAIGSSEFIVKYEEHFQTRNNYYFVYEYCNDGTLMDAIKRQGHFPEKKALKVFRQLLEAFKVLNRFNIMHRDIKPENIFFSFGRVKLGDFGFCKGLKQGEYMAKTMLGSPIYMAPQVLKGERYTIKADIWSLGVVLFEMLFGVCPYRSNSIAMLITTINKQEITIPLEINNISEETQNLLKKMLTKDYFRRINWVQLFHYKIDEEGNYVDFNVPRSPYSKSNKSISMFQDEKLSQVNVSFESKYNQIDKSFEQEKSSPSKNMYSDKYLNPHFGQVNSENKSINKKVSFFEGDFKDKFSPADQRFPLKFYISEKKIQADNPLASENIITKRQKLLSKHQQCIDSLNKALMGLQTRQVESIAATFVTLKKVEIKLKEIAQSIMISETSLLDIASLINYQIVQISRQLIETQHELHKRKISIPKPSLFIESKSYQSEILPPEITNFNNNNSFT